MWGGWFQQRLCWQVSSTFSSSTGKSHEVHMEDVPVQGSIKFRLDLSVTHIHLTNKPRLCFKVVSLRCYSQGKLIKFKLLALSSHCFPVFAREHHWHQARLQIQRNEHKEYSKLSLVFNTSLELNRQKANCWYLSYCVTKPHTWHFNNAFIYSCPFPNRNSK